MDFSELKENINEKFSDLSERLINFCQENKKLAIAAGAFILLLFTGLIVLTASIEKKKKKQPEKPYVLELSETLQIPESPELPKDYNISRRTKEKWDESETDEWFTVPSDTEIDSLANSNDNMINEIVGAAP